MVSPLLMTSSPMLDVRGQKVCWNSLWYSPFNKKMFVSEGRVDNTSLPFNGQRILNFNFLLVYPARSFSLLSPINRLLSGVRFCRVSLIAYFYATKICIPCRPSLYIFCSLLFYIFSIFANIEFKVSRLISLLYTPNKVLPSFCWNFHLTFTVTKGCMGYRQLVFE